MQERANKNDFVIRNQTMEKFQKARSLVLTRLENVQVIRSRSFKKFQLSKLISCRT